MWITSKGNPPVEVTHFEQCSLLLVFYFSFYSLTRFSLFSFFFLLPFSSLIVSPSTMHIQPFYPLTTFGLLWVSFQATHQFASCLATTTTLCQPCHASFPNKSGFFFFFFFFFTPINTPIRIRARLLPYQPLQHEPSDSSSCLPLFGEMSSQQDIFPKRA